jgi:hypothetical protein
MPFDVGGQILNYLQVKLNNTKSRLVRNKLISHLDASFSGSYPGSGSSWYDRTNNEYNASLVNGPTYNSGNGGFIQCDGSNDVIMLYSSGQYNFGTGNFGIGMWINTTATTGNIFQTYNCCSSYGAGVNSAGKFSFGFRDDSCNNNPNAVTTLSYNNGSWYYAFFQRVSGTAQIYINGSLVASNTVGGGSNVNISNASLQICNASSNACPVINNNNEGPLAAKIGAVHIYSKSLTADEITINFDATKTRFGY